MTFNKSEEIGGGLLYLSNTCTICANNHLLAYTVHILDNYSKILQNVRALREDTRIWKGKHYMALYEKLAL